MEGRECNVMGYNHIVCGVVVLRHDMQRVDLCNMYGVCCTRGV